jgi:hypothetical protein
MQVLLLALLTVWPPLALVLPARMRQGPGPSCQDRRNSRLVTGGPPG